MKVVLESVFYVRGNPITKYSSYPEFTGSPEALLAKEVKALEKQGSDYNIQLKVIKNSS